MGWRGGGEGGRGKNFWVRKTKEAKGGGERWVSLGGKNSVPMGRGERIVVITPGGGGWGVEGGERMVEEGGKGGRAGLGGGSLASRREMEESSV